MKEFVASKRQCLVSHRQTTRGYLLLHCPKLKGPMAGCRQADQRDFYEQCKKMEVQEEMFIILISNAAHTHGK